METHAIGPDAPARPQWPAWYGFAALGAAIPIAFIVFIFLYGIVRAGGAHVDANSGGVNITATVLQDAILILCALGLAARTAPPRPEQFGLRRTKLRRAIGWMLLAFAIYLVVALTYTVAVHPKNQTTLKDLGAGNGAFVTVLIGVLVVGIAPITEEFFFRGFFYGSLRTRLSFVPAAAVDALVFGGVHATTGVQAIPPLIILGFVFCMVYEATGSILPTIVMHSLNNMVAFGSDKDGSWLVSAVVAGTIITACLTFPSIVRRPRVSPT